MNIKEVYKSNDFYISNDRLSLGTGDVVSAKVAGCRQDKVQLLIEGNLIHAHNLSHMNLEKGDCIKLEVKHIRDNSTVMLKVLNETYTDSSGTDKLNVLLQKMNLFADEKITALIRLLIKDTIPVSQRNIKALYTLIKTKETGQQSFYDALKTINVSNKDIHFSYMPFILNNHNSNCLIITGKENNKNSSDADKISIWMHVNT